MPVQPSDSGRATIAPTSGSPPRSQSRASYRDTGLSIFAALLAFRIVNALALRTFFQPDEFFQSLEPAWQLAHGPQSNAWLTWEWRTQLRASLHPGLFAAVYLLVGRLADICGLSLPARAELLIAAPKLTQAVFAALVDCFTWKIAEKVYGRHSRTAFTALALSICSPWQWFCSTRTLSNCLETTLSSIAVYYWPWHCVDAAESCNKQRNHVPKQTHKQDILGPPHQLRLSLLLAAFACILRPTNGLIWLAIAIPTLGQCSIRQRYALVREISICGSVVLACSVLCDRAYYGAWTLPPVRFLYFNIAQSLAVFYGRNRPDYYLTEGLPLLLTTAVPFTALGLYRALRGQRAAPATSPTGQKSAGQSSLSDHSVSQQSVSPSNHVVAHSILSRLAWTSLFMTLSLSLIAHKEVRFLYPILPFLHVLAAQPAADFFLTPRHASSSFLSQLAPSVWRRGALISLLAINLLIAGYASQVHQRGVIDVLSYLRHKHEARIANGSNSTTVSTSVGFLMPCHSTPWRSHLVHPGISAWALGCEPPLNIPLSERSAYLDEADQFYIGPEPEQWLKKHMEHPTMITAMSSRSGQHWANLEPAKRQMGRKPWPHNLVFFEQLEPALKKYLHGTRYHECWRGFNSDFHDDWRRKGDVIVWCLD